MSKAKGTIINILSNGAAYLLPMILNFVTVPIVIHHLGEEAFGIQALTAAIMSYLMLSDMGLDIPIVKFTAEFQAKGDQSGIQRLLSSSFLIYIVIGSVMCLALWSTADLLADRVFNIQTALITDARQVFRWTGAGFIATMVTMWGQSYLKGIQDYGASNLIHIASRTMGALVGLVLVLMGHSIVYFIAAQILSYYLAAIWFLLLIQRKTGLWGWSGGFHKETFDLIKSHLGFGFLLRMTGALSSKSDQLILSSWLSVALAGLYAVPVLICTSLAALIGSLIHFSFPMSSELMSQGRSDELRPLFVRISKFIVPVCFLLFTPLVSLAQPVLTLWVSGEFSAETYQLLWVIGISTLLTVGLTTTSVNMMVGIGHIKEFTIYSLIRAVLLVVAMLVLIPRYQLMGAAWALAVPIPIDLALLHHAVRRYFGGHVRSLFRRVYLLPLILSILAAAVLYLVSPMVVSWIGLILASILFGLLYIGLLVLFGYIDEEDKALFRRMGRRLLRSN